MKHLIIFFLFLMLYGHAQDPLRFQSEVDDITKKYETLWNPSRETVVFTGSSSVRLWNDLQERFPEQQIVNSGFGGSQASDLLAYSNDLILKFNPKKVFIYEGDNDLADGKRIKKIVDNLQKIIDTIQLKNPTTQVVLIAAKPSLARWSKRKRYLRLNRRIDKLSQKNAKVEFANVWDIMLENGRPKPDIFISDGLHMNASGYDLWYTIVKNYLN